MDRNKKCRPHSDHCFRRGYEFVKKVFTPATIYPAPGAITVSDTGSGFLQWVATPTDTRQTTYILRRNEGTTAPASVTDGTDIPMSIGALVNGTTDATAVEGTTYSWTVFMKYTENGVVNYSTGVSATADIGTAD